MTRADHKKILLIGGVVAGSAIILATRLLVGEGFKKNASFGQTGLEDTLKKTRMQAAESYEQYKKTREQLPGLDELKAKIEAEAQTKEPQDATIKNLSEKLKTAEPTKPPTNQ